MRLLLPIDGSHCSQRAVEYVIANRLRFDAGADLELHLANVQSPVTGDVCHCIGGAQLADYHREQSGKALASVLHRTKNPILLSRRRPGKRSSTPL